jgi:hypothetical protein
MFHPVLVHDPFGFHRIGVAWQNVVRIGRQVLRMHQRRDHALSHGLDLPDGIPQDPLDAHVGEHVAPLAQIVDVKDSRRDIQKRLHEADLFRQRRAFRVRFDRRIVDPSVLHKHLLGNPSALEARSRSNTERWILPSAIGFGSGPFVPCPPMIASYLPFLLPPIVGALIGWGTNWLALKMLFRPIVPFRLGPWSIQGVIPRRQGALAANLGEMVERELVSHHDLAGA